MIPTQLRIPFTSRFSSPYVLSVLVPAEICPLDVGELSVGREHGLHEQSWICAMSDRRRQESENKRCRLDDLLPNSPSISAPSGG